MTKNVEFLVIGSGIAGLSFALKAAKHGKVLIVTKSNEDESNTKYAQGGVAVVVDKEEDSFEIPYYATSTQKIYEINASNTFLSEPDVANLKKGDLLIIRNAIVPASSPQELKLIANLLSVNLSPILN